jgi:hypothetical protein
VVCKEEERTVTGYPRQVWDTNTRLCKEQHTFGPGYTLENQIVTVCQDIDDSLDEGARVDAITTDFSKAFDLFLYDWLLMKIEASGLDSRVDVWKGNSF